MDKFEYELKVEQIEKLIGREDYSTAKKIADTMEWKKEKDAALLSKVAELYTRAGDINKAMTIYNRAYNASARGLLILERMTELAINYGQLELAVELCQEYRAQGAYEPDVCMFEFQISEAKGEDYEKRIPYLERYCKYEIDEDALYKLAELYNTVGRRKDCVRICNYLIDFFCFGENVEKAARLKRAYEPLDKYQEEKLSKALLYEENFKSLISEEETLTKKEETEKKHAEKILQDAYMQEQENDLGKQISEIVEDNEKQKSEIKLDGLVADEELRAQLELENKEAETEAEPVEEAEAEAELVEEAEAEAELVEEAEDELAEVEAKTEEEAAEAEPEPEAEDELAEIEPKTEEETAEAEPESESEEGDELAEVKIEAETEAETDTSEPDFIEEVAGEDDDEEIEEVEIVTEKGADEETKLPDNIQIEVAGEDDDLEEEEPVLEPKTVLSDEEMGIDESMIETAELPGEETETVEADAETADAEIGEPGEPAAETEEAETEEAETEEAETEEAETEEAETEEAETEEAETEEAETEEAEVEEAEAEAGTAQEKSLEPFPEAKPERVKVHKDLSALELMIPEGSFTVACSDTALGEKYALELVRLAPEETGYEHIAKTNAKKMNKAKFSSIEEKLDNDILMITGAGQLSNGALDNLYAWMKKSLENRVILIDDKASIEALKERRPKLMKRFSGAYEYEKKDKAEWLELVESYADENDCTLADDAKKLFGEYLDSKEDENDVVLGINLKEAIQDAMHEASKTSISNLLSSVLSTKYDEEGLLVLRDRHFL